MKIWRLEDVDGFGPYTSKNNEDLSWDLKMAHSTANEHPGPESDGFNDILWGCKEYPWAQLLFGFASEYDARNWFCDFWDKLINNGFKLVEYESDIYWMGESNLQLLFYKEVK